MAAGDLIWEATPKLFLVLEEGELASSFYLPPLAGISIKEDYGETHFLKAQIVAGADTPQIVVFVRTKYTKDRVFSTNPNYVRDDHEYDSIGVSVTRILYNIAPEYYTDYHIFTAGKYSKMSVQAKTTIRELSGVRYKFPGSSGTFIYDKKLLVLERAPMLRTFFERMLDTRIDKEAELLDKPGPDNYWMGHD